MISLKEPKYLSITLLSFLFLGPVSLHSQNESEKLMDSILEFAENDSIKVMYLIREASQKMRYDPSSQKFIRTAIQIAHKTEDDILLANAYYNAGNFYFFNSKMDSSLVMLDKADEFLPEGADDLLKASIFSTKGGVFRRFGDVIPAISASLEAKAILENIDSLSLNQVSRKRLKGKMFILNNALANLYLDIDDFENALAHYDMSYNLALNRLKDTLNASVILSNKGELLNKMKNFSGALKISLKAKAMKQSAGLPARYIAMSDYHIGSAYVGLDSIKKGSEYFNSSLEKSKEIKFQRGIMYGLAERGLLQFEMGLVEEAKRDCQEALGLATTINDAEFKMRSCLCLYKVENALRNYKTSLANFEQYTGLKDSIFNEKNVRKLTQMGMQYEFDKKEAEQQLIIEKKNRQRNRLLAGSMILALFALLLFIFFRKRLKYQKKIARQERELKNQEIIKLKQDNKLTAMNSVIAGQEKERSRIAKDLHDGLGSLLGSVKSHFLSVTESSKIKDGKLIEKTTVLIDRACSETRRISHNMMPHVLTISGLEDGVKDIVERLKIDNYEVDLEIKDLPKLDPVKEVTVYRLVQELLSNIKKHANAKSVFIQLYSHGNEIYLTVEDDGNGFDLEETKNKKGLGLQSVESRVAFLDGDVVWDSQKGAGTTVNISFAA